MNATLIVWMNVTLYALLVNEYGMQDTNTCGARNQNVLFYSVAPTYVHCTVSALWYVIVEGPPPMRVCSSVVLICCTPSIPMCDCKCQQETEASGTAYEPVFILFGSTQMSLPGVLHCSYLRYAAIMEGSPHIFHMYPCIIWNKVVNYSFIGIFAKWCQNDKLSTFWILTVGCI